METPAILKLDTLNPAFITLNGDLPKITHEVTKHLYVKRPWAFYCVTLALYDDNEILMHSTEIFLNEVVTFTELMYLVDKERKATAKRAVTELANAKVDHIANPWIAVPWGHDLDHNHLLYLLLRFAAIPNQELKDMGTFLLNRYLKAIEEQ